MHAARSLRLACCDLYEARRGLCAATCTKLAEVLPRAHLDELLQLLLVFTGTRTLAGPQPRMATEVPAFLYPQFDQARVGVPQGCTGLWQISPAQADRVSDPTEYDLWHLSHGGTRLDAWILVRTLRLAFGGAPVSLRMYRHGLLGRAFLARVWLTGSVSGGWPVR